MEYAPLYESLDESFAETSPEPAVLSPETWSDVPRTLSVLPDGRDTVITGDVVGLREFNHRQGDKPGFEGTCGLVSCEDVLRQFGVQVTEADLVEHAVTNQLCYVSDDPTKSGGTTLRCGRRVIGQPQTR